MGWPQAILLTAFLVLASVAVSFATDINAMPIVVGGTALWAAVDSHTIELKRYKSGLSYGPIVLCVAVALLWIIAFPWYLVVRHRIKSGRADLKATAAESAS